MAERRGLARFRVEQPPYSVLNRGIESEVLPICQKYGLGVNAWSPLAKGMLTGKYRKDQKTPDTLRAKHFPKLVSDERSLDAIEQLLAVAAEAGLSLTHLSLAFVIAHPGITAAILGPRTPAQLDDLLGALGVALSDELLDRIDQIVPPGSEVAPLEGAAYVPPAIKQPALRRRPLAERQAS